MSNQILDKALTDKLATGEKIFVPYIMAGDGGLDILEERLDFKISKPPSPAIIYGTNIFSPVASLSVNALSKIWLLIYFPSSASFTCSTSLSPRPDKQMTRD